MYINDSNILASGPSYQIVANTLKIHYQECLNWLNKAGLCIKSEKTEVIFYSLFKPHPETHSPRLASIMLPANNAREITINSSDDIHYLRLFINHKLSWHRHINIMAMHT